MKRSVDVSAFPPAIQQQLRAKYQAAVASSPSPFTDAPRGTPEPRSKYSAQAVVVDGFRFDSKLEARWYEHLKQLQGFGQVLRFHRQVPLELAPRSRYVVDFLVFYADGSVEYHDVKGFDTPHSKTKRKVAEDRYAIAVHVITREAMSRDVRMTSATGSARKLTPPRRSGT